MIRSFSLFISLACALAAEPVDWIWTARWVVTMDAQRRVIDHGAVAIRGEWSVEGRWVWIWKNWLDTSFIRRFSF